MKVRIVKYKSLGSAVNETTITLDYEEDLEFLRQALYSVFSNSFASNAHKEKAQEWINVINKALKDA